MRSRLSVLLVPWIVGVAPAVAPAEDSTVRLWPTSDMFLKLIVTLPAFALSAAVLKERAPSGFASTLRAPDADPEDSVPPEAEVDGVLAAGVSGVLAEELELDELPQPARTMSPRSNAPAARLRVMRPFGLACELIVTV